MRTFGLLGVVSLSLALTACSGSDEPESTASWQLVWSDEFDGDTLDTSKWSHEINCAGGGNNEQQCYTDRPENTQLVDGMLHIIALEESFSGPGMMDFMPNYDPADTSATQPYTSARVVTRDKYEVMYGRFEMRARIPKGQGTWPAFWMMPAEDVYGGWPLSGEIDIMEGFNNGVPDREKVTGATQYGMNWPNYVPKDDHYHPAEKLTEDFYTYAVEWEADEIRWYIDGEHYMTQRSENWYTGNWGGQDVGLQVPTPRAPFDQPFYIILNLAMGGNATGPADTGWAEPRILEVDYVRVYQCDAGNEDGTGCAGIADPVNPDIEPLPDDGGPTVSTFELFTNAPATLELPQGDGTVRNTLQLTSDGFVSATDSAGNIRAVFAGEGEFALASGDLSANPALANSVELVGRMPWANQGQIEFDLTVNLLAEDTVLSVTMGGVDGKSVAISPPDEGESARVFVRVFDIIDPDVYDINSIDVTSVDPLFVLQANGAADVEIDNVAISCAVTSANISWLPEQSCGIGPSVNVLPVESPAVIFDGAISDWPMTSMNGVARIELVEEEGRGDVVSVNFSGSETFATLGSPEVPKDFSVMAGGTLTFDLKILAEPDGTSWDLIVDCSYPCSSGNVPLSDSNEGAEPVIGEWQTYTFNVDDLVNRENSSLDLSRVHLPALIMPSWTNQAGAAYLLDNVVYTAPE